MTTTYRASASTKAGTVYAYGDTAQHAAQALKAAPLPKGCKRLGALFTLTKGQTENRGGQDMFVVVLGSPSVQMLGAEACIAADKYI